MMDERPAEIALELASEKLLRAVYSERQLQEVLTDFWFNHFNVFAGKDQDRWAIGTYEREAIRPNIFGKFRDLLGATTHHPAMLVYLDNWRSVREGLPQKGGKPPRGPNENYARELLELHTLGVDGGYQQADVAEVAKAFTGWTIDQPQTLATFAFRPKQHDETAKTVLGRSIHGGGEKDGDAVLDLVAASPSTAHFLARKLAIRFVGDKPAEALVQKLAARFTATGGDLTAVYKTLFSADEFWDSGLAKVKTPFQLATSSIRALGGNYDGSPQLVHRLGKLGEPLYQCQPPTGYRDTAKAWVSAGTLVARMNFGTDLARNKIPGVSYDPAAVVANLPTDLLGLVAAAGKKVLGRGPTRTTESAITDGLQATLNKKGKARDADKQAESLVGLLLASPEFQKS